MSKYSDVYKAIFGEDYKKESYQMKHHVWKKAIAGKQVCQSCGLVALNNEFTRWSIDKGCYSDLHPEFKSARKRFTKL